MRNRSRAQRVETARPGRPRWHLRTMNLTVNLALLVLSASAVVAAGTMLTRSADAIAERTGVGRVWIGSVVLAAATSLPELVADVAAVRIRAPDLAAGDLFGSSLANMMILALIDLLAPRRHVLRNAALENALGACLAIILNLLVGVFILLRLQWRLLGLTPASLLLVVIYVGGTRAVYRNGRRAAEEAAPAAAARQSAASTLKLRSAAVRFAAAALVILISAPVLAWSAKQLAITTGLATSFVGTLLLGLITSLPELATSVAAVQIGAFDLAVGNLFGSNAFNMVIFIALDLVHSGDSIFGALAPINVLSASLAVVVMALGLASIVYRAERRFAALEPGSALMLVAYVVSVAVIFVQGRKP
jgi:cation:H+ antiporter